MRPVETKRETRLHRRRKDAARAVGEEHQRGVSRLPEDLEGRVGAEEPEGFVLGVVDAEHVRALGDSFAELGRGQFAI